MAPLAHAHLWHRDPPRTSQRRAAALALSDARVAFVNGGNRAGKTDLGAQWAVAHALGRDHPDVRAWLANNGLDGRRIQRGPGVVWAVSLTFPDSRRYVREKLDRYLPGGTTRRNWGAENEAEALLPGGGKILCKAWAQGRAGFQGDAIHAAWVDEEPGDQPAWNELLMRLADHDGRVLVTFTPGLMGLTWVYERYVKEPPPGVAACAIFGVDNPHVPADVLRELLAQFGAHERAARERGEWVQLEGRVWAQWRRDLHVIPARPIPPQWRRWRGIDFGVRDPFACVWVARDPSSGQHHLYRVLHRPQYTTRQNGDEINRLTGIEVIEASVADSAGLDQRRTLSAECKITTQASPKDIREGVNAVAELLEPDAEGHPGLLVHDTCTPFIREIEGYRWADKAREVPEDRDNHSLDALRYLLLWLKRQRGMGAS
jgi:phage terminase large subunit-like protein